MRASEFTGAVEHTIERFPYEEPHVVVKRTDVRASVAPPDRYEHGDSVESADPVTAPLPVPAP